MSSKGVANSRTTLVRFARKCREVAWQTIVLHPIARLGGPGIIVQIDESMFNHKSKISFRVDFSRPMKRNE